MPSKITGVTTPEPVVPPKGAGTGGAVNDKLQGEAASGSTASQPNDQVTLTASARSLQKLSDAVAASPVVDSAKVAATKAAIANGTYRIDAQSVANKLLKLDGSLR